MKKLLSIVLCLLIGVNLSGQEARFSSKELKKDLDSLVSFIEQVHPNPYANVSKKEIYKAIKRCDKMLSDSIGPIQYFTMISPIVSRLMDGHTGVSFPYAEWRALNPYCFPFNPEISSEGKLFVPENMSDLPQGAELLSINGVSGRQIFQTLINSISGESTNFRMSILKQSFVERFGAFYGFKSGYKIKYKLGGETNTVTISGYKLNDLLKLMKKRKSNAQTKGSNENAPYAFKLLADKKTGLIDFNSFSGEKQFAAFLDTAFSTMQREKAENLIIDLRSNGGGNSALGDELFQYISNVPFAQFGKTTIKYSDKRRQFYESYRKEGFLANLNDSAFNALVSQKSDTVLKYENSLIALRDNKLRFKGNVYLLTGNKTFSSASKFAWCFHHFNMGKIVGEETGGYIVCFGDIIYSTLPKSKLQIHISHKEFYGYGATDQDRHAVIPDYKVNANDALDFTLKLIDKTTFPKL